MYGFYLTLGKQGSGKTAFIIKHLVDEKINNPNRKIFSNATLYNYDYTPITFDKPNQPKKIRDNIDIIDILDVLQEDTEYFNDSIMIIDEIHVYFDSRDFMRKNIRKIQAFFSQLRKRNIFLLATTQYILNLDIRIRRQALAVFEMQKIEGSLFQADFHSIDGYYTEFIRSDLYDLKDYFKYYNTNEIIT